MPRRETDSFRIRESVQITVKKGTVHFLFVFVNESIDEKIIR